MAARDKYPWEEWSDGQAHTLKQDHDFTSLQGLRSAAQQQALRRDGKYRITQLFRGYDDQVRIQFIPNHKVAVPESKAVRIDIAFIERLVRLTHPDRHESLKRKEEATAVTARLNALRDELRIKERRGY